MNLEQHWEETTLDNLGKGVLKELFDPHFKTLLENLADLNTNPKAKRELTIKISARTDGNRQQVEYTVQPVLKLAPILPFEGHLLIGVDKGKIKAYENQFEQPSMFDGNVTPIKGATNA